MAGHGGGGHGGHGGGRWGRGWGYAYPGWWGGQMLWDRDIDVNVVSGNEPSWGKCRLKSPVSYFDESGTKRAIPSGTVVLATPDGAGFIKINYGGLVVRAASNVCEATSGADASGANTANQSFQDANKVAFDKLVFERKVHAGFILTGAALGLWLAYTGKKTALGYLWFAALGMGGGGVLGWMTKDTITTLFAPGGGMDKPVQLPPIAVKQS